MRTVRPFLLGCLLFAWSAGRMSAQSPAEPAAQKRAGSAREGEPGKAYTNDDMEISSDAPASPPEQKGAGEVNVTYQSFYNRINSSTTANAGGASISFLQFFPERGLFSLRFEPIADRGSFAAGENYLQWKGLPWKGRHWDFALGDFHIGTALHPMQIANLVQPDFFLRGANLTARTAHWRYSFYAGLETLAQGPRIPFRERVPQNALGVETAGSPWDRLKLGFRYLHLTSPENAVSQSNTFLPLGRGFTRSDSLTAQSTVKLAKSLDWYSEAGWNSAEKPISPAVPNSPFSFVTGPAWSTPHLVVHANYVRAGVAYLPLLGYFLGDRQGQYVDGTLQVGRLGLSGSLGQSRNNLEKNPEVTNFSSHQSSGGLQLRLPLAFNLSASVSKINLETRPPADAPSQPSDNRQLNVSLSRPLFRHNLRASFQQLDIHSNGQAQRLRFSEFEDTYHWSRFTVGGAIRLQHSVDVHRKDSLFFRGTAQVLLRRFNLYAYIEQGKDLANSTLFATNAVSTSVAGISWNAPHQMEMQVEFLRNNTNTNLNPASIFVLSSQGIPLDSALARFSNWSLFIRATRHFEWGERLSLDSRGEVKRQVSLTGTLQGFVKLQTMAGEFGAADVYVVLDSGIKVKTDANGYFAIPKVAEGQHSVALNLDQLPTDLNPSGQSELPVLLSPEKATRVEFRVVPLQTLTGAVLDIAKNPAPEGVVIRLSPGNQYTTTDRAGRFGFYNLPEGDYVIELDDKSLPEYAHLVTASRLALTIRYGNSAADANFIYQIVPPPPKPLQEILLRGHEASVRSIIVPSGPASSHRAR